MTPMRHPTAITVALFPVFVANGAAAEQTIFKSADTEVFTDGRVGVFVSYARGDALPRPTYDAAGNVTHTIEGGGVDGLAERQSLGTNGQLSQGTLEGVRLRSGFIGNIFGMGVKTRLAGADVTAYLQLISVAESAARIMMQPNPIDVRQGFVKVQGSWGAILAGRTRSLFSRGGTDIDALYGHGYGVGFPASVDSHGPASGHIGFGIVGAGEDSGIVYESPTSAGVQLTVGLYDPFQIEGAWRRTKWPRPEAELTYNQSIAGFGKFVLFGNGAFQDLYEPDAIQRTSVWGVGYGGRVELGPVHVGVAGHHGKGIGIDY